MLLVFVNQSTCPSLILRLYQSNTTVQMPYKVNRTVIQLNSYYYLSVSEMCSVFITGLLCRVTSIYLVNVCYCSVTS